MLELEYKVGHRSNQTNRQDRALISNQETDMLKIYSQTKRKYIEKDPNHLVSWIKPMNSNIGKYRTVFGLISRGVMPLLMYRIVQHYVLEQIHWVPKFHSSSIHYL